MTDIAELVEPEEWNAQKLVLHYTWLISKASPDVESWSKMKQRIADDLHFRAHAPEIERLVEHGVKFPERLLRVQARAVTFDQIADARFEIQRIKSERDRAEMAAEIAKNPTWGAF